MIDAGVATLLVCLAGYAPIASAQTTASYNDLHSLHGMVFEGQTDDDARPSATPLDEQMIAAARRAFAPFEAPLRVGGALITQDRTGLTDMVAARGPTKFHGEGEIAYSLACWASLPAGDQVALSSALDAAPPFRINGWTVAREVATPNGCTPTTHLHPGQVRLPSGLAFGDTLAQAARVVGVPTTARSADVLDWFCILPGTGRFSQSSQTVSLRLQFVAGRLAVVSFSSILTD